jgi:hypothetical protein
MSISELFGDGSLTQDVAHIGSREEALHRALALEIRGV